MDDPSLDAAEHMHARRGLARLNELSAAAAALWLPISHLAADLGVRQLRVLDIASGSADVLIKLWQIAQRQSIDLQIDGCDFSQTALEDARANAEAAFMPSKFFRLKVLQDSLPGSYD